MTQRLEVMLAVGPKSLEGSFVACLVLDTAISQDLNQAVLWNIYMWSLRGTAWASSWWLGSKSKYLKRTRCKLCHLYDLSL